MVYRRLAAIPVLLLLTSIWAAGECKNQPTDGTIVANPNRPTISGPADITQFGVLESEYGYERTWAGGGERDHDFGGLLKFSVLCDVEIRWTPDTYVQRVTGSSSVQGGGDNWIGAQFRLHHQSPRVPTLSFRYEAKVPTASVVKGLGSGAVDHSLTFLASKDIGKYHFNFNSGYLLAGRTGSSGYDKNVNLALAFSHSIVGRLGCTGEGYGETKLNNSTPAYASALWAFTYQASPRLVLDSGIDVGVTSGSPGKHFFVGMTYAIADLYAPFRKSRVTAARNSDGADNTR